MATERMLIWEGKSELTGEDLIVLATGVPTKGSKARKSSNVKTGDMIQIAILRADVNPTEALKLGLDTATCGNCPFRSVASGGDGGCYTHKSLRRGHAQTSSWNAHARKGSVPFDLSRFEGQRVRFGSYGDPAAVPFEVWEAIAAVADGVTGYTHQWRTADPRFAELCMASADTVGQRREARMKGYRTFRPRPGNAPREAGEVVCPASAEAGFKTTCSTCMACGGNSTGRKQDITIILH
ncbi:hypothetical protein Pukovnik_87 [Mycobacterium phage Pukovnik]|uniref:Uncharacterized protein n=1 Tax=Mycobacterium phage Pukovnik TaxID=2914013 RepID=B3VGN6_9CAUD|nr:hypothetical protein Pukovnik_87 [Mycobacterium phage Pukovnik]ACE80013.1 hypothetical protein Pukovnik_87 [Mycobacterium phage Pukovnik]